MPEESLSGLKRFVQNAMRAQASLATKRPSCQTRHRESTKHALPLTREPNTNYPMRYPANVVSIHPYFKVHPGQMAAFKAALPAFIEKTRAETDNLFYEFTVNGDEVFCREAYRGAAGALAHLANVGGDIPELFKISTLTRLEVHGPASELDLLRGPLAEMNPAWFILEAGLQR
jgi:hypothetical protein